MNRVMLFVLAAVCALSAQQYTRGVGLYPGDPKEFHGPAMVVDATTYRNLALHRPAYQSSAYDYNLTAQLVTDGIRDSRLPRWIVGSSSLDGVLPKFRREHLVDSNPVTTVDIPPTGGWVQLELDGGESAPEVDRLEVAVRPESGNLKPQPWTAVVLTSDDGQAWTESGRATNDAVLGSMMWFLPYFVKMSVPLTSSVHSRFYRVQLDAPGVGKWEAGDLAFFNKSQPVQMGGPFHFTSAWKSAGSGEEWVYVDLGADCTFDRVVLAWIRRAVEGAVQVSSDAKNWQTVQALPAAGGDTDDLKLAQPAHGRYVRVLMTRAASGDGYILSEFEVYGKGGLAPKPIAAPKASADGRLELAGGNWRLQRDSLVGADGAAVSQPGFQDKDWMPATVPGTILSSYWDDGAVPDPNFGDNQLTISDSFFYSDFWYRDEIVVPAAAPGKHVWLNFDGINWKAEVFFNGERLGEINGGFTRGRFDVTRLLRTGKNALAVLVHKNASPGSVKEKTLAKTDSNGGVLGADNPTYHATIGWDWIPTIRGRDTGIWGSVYLSRSGAVTIEKPFASTTLPLPDTSSADVTVEATLRNHEQKAVTGTVSGTFGTLRFTKRVTVAASSSILVRFNPETDPALRMSHPKLWWPAGYGAQNLYPVKISFQADAGGISDDASFQTGVREFSYSDEGGALKIWINGRRFIARGGNWGFPESMLRYRSREYDVAMRYHQDMNFTMIRNWVGQNPDDAFYEAADKHGIVIWQDFWLANPWDGPDPDDNAMFMQNATDLVERIRNHPSLGLYCGRNEGYPPKPLEEGLRKLLASEHPGLHYIPNSAWDTVSGGGPYHAMSQKFYFQQRATPKLHSELGMANIVTMDSLKQMMPEDKMWRQSDLWGMHDFTLDGAQDGAAYRELIEKSYGATDNAADWVEFAQFENYNGYRAMFEAQSKNRMGVLLWMSHPAWPCFVWQTYDYYFDPTAAYFGSKKASEPLHIQWNPVSDAVEVVNYSGGNNTGLTAHAEILNLDGSKQWEKSATLDSAEDSVQSPMQLEFPSSLSPVQFIKLKLSKGADVISENFYWRGTEEENYQALRQLPKVKIEESTKTERKGSSWVLTTELANPSQSPVLMVRVKAVREKSGDRILPAIYSDNYIALMPGEKRTVRTEVADADTRGESPKIVVEGFNTK